MLSVLSVLGNYMKKQTVQIPRTLANQLLHQAQLSPDKEVCGLIGKQGEHVSCYPVENVATDPQRLFALDAKAQIDAFAQMTKNGQQLFAIYHSHPYAPAEPSAIDLAQVNYPEALYLIISLNTKGVLEMRGYYLTQAQAQEVDLII